MCIYSNGPEPNRTKPLTHKPEFTLTYHQNWMTFDWVFHSTVKHHVHVYFMSNAEHFQQGFNWNTLAEHFSVYCFAYTIRYTLIWCLSKWCTNSSTASQCQNFDGVSWSWYPYPYTHTTFESGIHSWIVDYMRFLCSISLHGYAHSMCHIQFYHIPTHRCTEVRLNSEWSTPANGTTSFVCIARWVIKKFLFDQKKIT